ncbi:MAG: hypothetical protein Q8Q52_05400 [Acidimicrobiia bacterium]|nr:hypothetical protein [Acidimicrobiia bacterium]
MLVSVRATSEVAQVGVNHLPYLDRPTLPVGVNDDDSLGGFGIDGHLLAGLSLDPQDRGITGSAAGAHPNTSHQISRTDSHHTTAMPPTAANMTST